ncbi:MAG TPA: choice-of-anchor J domain-containing protein, partial [Pyrinomonadaceae bacterium]|jgi:hypothetical protein
MSRKKNIKSLSLSRPFKNTVAVVLIVTAFLLAGGMGVARAQIPISEGFENITQLPAAGWFMQNNSTPTGTTGWFQGNSAVFPAQAGPVTSYIAANFNNTTGANTISNWLLTPNRTFSNGDVVRFWTRTVAANPFPERLEVRLSSNGASTDVGTGSTAVGDFTTLLRSINPDLTVGAYPEVWTEFTIILSGLPAGGANGRIAFRYFVTSGGPTGDNSNYIGIDSFSYAPVIIGDPFGDTPLDYDGDGKTDIAVWRANADPAQNFFFVRKSSDGALSVFEWGQQGDYAVARINTH